MKTGRVSNAFSMFHTFTRISLYFFNNSFFLISKYTYFFSLKLLTYPFNFESLIHNGPIFSSSSNPMKNLESVFLFLPYDDASDIVLSMSTLHHLLLLDFHKMKPPFNVIATESQGLLDHLFYIILSKKRFFYMGKGSGVF